MHKGGGVFDHPTDAVEPAGFHVAAPPVDHLADRVHVRRVGSGGAGSEAGSARVGKEVEDLGVGPCDRDLVINPFPVAGLLGEDAQVLERRALEAQGELATAQVVGEGPLAGGSGLEGPIARLGVLLGPAEVRVGQLRPFGGGKRRSPHCLGLRAPKHLAAKALELGKVAAVQQLVVGPGRYGHVDAQAHARLAL